MLFLIAIAGAIGAMLRYVLSTWIQSRFQALSLYATTIINMIGSFLLGISFGLNNIFPSDNSWYTIVATGFFGAFTTFSTFSYEALTLYLNSPKKGVLFVLGNIVCAILFASLAIIIVT